MTRREQSEARAAAFERRLKDPNCPDNEQARIALLDRCKRGEITADQMRKEAAKLRLAGKIYQKNQP